MDKQETYDILTNIDVFSKIRTTDLHHMVDSGIQKKVSKNEYLCHQGDDWPYALVVLRGELVRTLLSITGKEKILHTIKPGVDFWSHTIFDGKPAPASISTLTESEICLWDKEAVLEVLYRNPDAFYALTGRLIKLMRTARELIYGLAFQPVAARLARVFVERFHSGDEPQSERDLTLDQIAAMISSSPQVVCRVMYEFQEAGILDVSRATIAIQNPDALRELSKIA
jgi:CRP/FNR family transcriptional regulator